MSASRQLLHDLRSPLVGPAARMGEDIDFGYQLGADDELEASAVGNDYIDAVNGGFSPAAAARRAKSLMQQRRQQFRQNRCFNHPIPGPGMAQFRSRLGGEDDFIEGDVLDGVDEEELGAIDEEIGSLEGEDDEVGADDAIELGGIPQVKRKIGRLEDLLSKLEARYNSTPSYRAKKRKHLLARIARVKARIGKKQEKLQKKQEKLAAKLGIPVAVLAAGAGGLAAAGLSRADVARAEAGMERGAADAASGIMSFWGPRMPPGGTEVSLPFLFSNQPGGLFTKAAGGAGVSTVTGTTAPISYADFEILGADLQILASAASEADLLFYATCVSWGVSGGFSQVYGETPITHLGGQSGSLRAGLMQFGRSFTAMRQDSVRLGRTNTAQITLNLYQQITHAATINVQVTGTLRARILTDDNLRRMG